jgi:hypothetical protein
MATGKPSPASNYHLTEINQPRLDIKKPRAGRPGLLVLIFGQAAWGGVGKLSTSPINFWRSESFLVLNRQASC